MKRDTSIVCAGLAFLSVISMGSAAHMTGCANNHLTVNFIAQSLDKVFIFKVTVLFIAGFNLVPSKGMCQKIFSLNRNLTSHLSDFSTAKLNAQ